MDDGTTQACSWGFGGGAFDLRPDPPVPERTAVLKRGGRGSACIPVGLHPGQWIALIVVLVGLLFPPASWAQKRVALVIGNADYVRDPLVNPINDAADLAAALRRLGFEVIERRNRNPDELRRDLIEFQDRLSAGAVGLFYFAGHGVQAATALTAFAFC